MLGHLVAQLVGAQSYKPEGWGLDFWWSHWNFSLVSSFLQHCGSEFSPASNRNEYQDFFLEGKGTQCVGLTTLPLHVPIVQKSGNLNPLELSGPVIGLHRHSFALLLILLGTCHLCSLLSLLERSCSVTKLQLPRNCICQHITDTVFNIVLDKCTFSALCNSSHKTCNRYLFSNGLKHYTFSLLKHCGERLFYMQNI